MTPKARVWWLSVGRLAFARCHYQAITGWRRLWWRFWWRSNAPVLVKMVLIPTPKVERPLFMPPKGPIHFVTGQGSYPICGASLRDAWAFNLEAVTCEVCKLDGAIYTVDVTLRNK
jgi:hypothetical protein